MRQFLYYWPTRQTAGINANQVKDLGITWLLEHGKQPEWVQVVNNGPDGGVGVCFARENDDSGKYPIGYYKARQTWEKAPGFDYWVGYFNDAKPGPVDLARGECRGHAIRCRDGEQWLVQPTRLIKGVMDIPMGLALDRDGELVGEALPEYSQIVSDAETIWNWHVSAFSDSPQELGRVEMMQAIARVLGRNYRVGLAEVNLLRLVTTENIGEMCRAIIDWPTYLAMMAAEDESEKKTDQTET